MEDEFINNAEEKINRIINDLGWSIEYFQTKKPVELVCCPNNNAHRMHPDNLETHLETCEWTSAGYQLYDLPLPLNESVNSFIQFTPKLQEEIISEAALKDESFQKGGKNCSGQDIPGFAIWHTTLPLADEKSKPRMVPMSSNRMMQDFSRDERRALYDYVISKSESSVKITLPATVAQPKTEEKRELTKLEILSAERDAKRRRATYRNKVHTNRKTHVEIMREVIDSQMNCLIDESTESSNSKQNLSKKVETSKNEYDDLKNRYSDISHKSHTSNRSDRREFIDLSTDNRSRSSHRSRSDHSYHDSDYFKSSKKDYISRSSQKRRHDETRDESKEKRRKHEGYKSGFNEVQREDQRTDVKEAEKGVESHEQNSFLEKVMKEIMKKEKKHKKNKHKKKKRKKKKKNTSTDSSDSD